MTQNYKDQRKEVYNHIEGYDLDAIEAAKVMVVGAGALGNEVLKNLALLNVGHILIVDFDIIEAHNLSRSVLFRQEDCDGLTLKSFTAAKRLKEINPNVKVKVINGDILSDVGLGVYRRMDSIIGCLDNMLARQSINRSAFKVNASWIDGGLSDDSGMVASYKNNILCYECNLSEADHRAIQERYSCPDKIRRYASEGRMPTTPINASIIAALQAQEAMNEINKLSQFSILGQRIKYFGRSNEMLSTKPGFKEEFKHDEFCLSDDALLEEEIISAPELSADISFDDFMKWAKSYFKSEDITLFLDHEFVTKLVSEKTGEIIEANRPRMNLDDAYIFNLKGDNYDDVIIIKEATNEIDESFIGKGYSLRDLGVPYLHIVNLYVDGEDKYVELSGDESFLKFE